MITVNRIVRIEWRNSPSVFELINKAAFSTEVLRLGGAHKPVQYLLSRTDELAVLLPTIIGTSPSNPDWQDKVAEYLDSFLLEVPKIGLAMNASYNISLQNPRTKENLEIYQKRIGTKTDETITQEEWIAGNISGKYSNGKNKVAEEDLYMYADVVNKVDYLNWRMCLLSAKVANNPEDIHKSVNIDFYLTSEEQIKETKRSSSTLKDKAIKYYMEVISSTDSKLLNQILIASENIAGIEHFKDLEQSDKHTMLLDMATTNPKQLLDLKEDKSLATRSLITMYLWYNILKYVNNTSTIVDSTDSERVLGNSMEEVITYFANERNKAHVAEMGHRYNSLKQ